MTPPQKLTIPSDGNIIQFVRMIKTKTEISYEYIYIKGEVQLGKTVTFSEKGLNDCLRKEILK